MMNRLPLLHPAELEATIQAFSGTHPPQAILISGMAGIGRLAFAEALAASLLFTPAEALDRNADFQRLALAEDARSIGVDETRVVCSRLRMSPAHGGRRILLVENADVMSDSATNAMLKTLEEPPAGAVILIIAARPSLIPATIRSRCQTRVLQVPRREQALALLGERLEGRPETELSALLELAGGSPGQAIDLAAADAGTVYGELLEILGPVTGKASRVSRTRLQAFADRRGGKESWPVCRHLTSVLLHRAALHLSGIAQIESVPGETRLFEALKGKATSGSLCQAHDLAQRIANDTDGKFLDTIYATQRMILAVEHTVLGQQAR